MNYFDLLRRIAVRGFSALAALAMLAPVHGRCETEQTFDVLTIGARTFKNVTVTTKAQNYVMLMHSEGLANIKVADLSPELRRTLGYSEPQQEHSRSKGAAVTKWATEKLATLKIGQVRAMELNVAKALQERGHTDRLQSIGKPSLQVILGAASGALLAWILVCSCFNRICKNAGKQSSPLIWFPVLQSFPLLIAAGMSPFWILLPPIAGLVWCFKISTACGKSALTGICLLLPGLSLFAFFYLVFSASGRQDQGRPAKQERRVALMTLETA